MYLGDLPPVFVSRLEVAPRFHSAEETRYSTTSTCSLLAVKFLILICSHLIFVGGSNVCTRERVDTFDEAFLYWLLSKLEKILRSRVKF